MARLLFFGPLRDVAARSPINVEVPTVIKTVGELVTWLGQSDALLAGLLAASSTKIAVDQVIVDRDASIANASEIAFLPPMSGG